MHFKQKCIICRQYPAFIRVTTCLLMFQLPNYYLLRYSPPAIRTVALFTALFVDITAISFVIDRNGSFHLHVTGT